MLPARVAPGEILLPVDLEAVAVELNLMHPIIRTGDDIDLRGEQRLNIARKRCAFGIWHVGGVDPGGRVDALDVLLSGLRYAPLGHGDSMTETFARSRRWSGMSHS